MANRDNQSPPPRNSLPIFLYSIITNLEDLLQLRYPVGPFRASPQIQQNPTFELAIKAILALPPALTAFRRRRLSGMNNTFSDTLVYGDSTDTDFNQRMHNQPCAISQQERNQQQVHDARPITVLIYNARGIARPSFIPSLTEAMAVYNPLLMIITETRSVFGQQLLISHCPNHSIMQSIDPIVYLGGSWILYDRSQKVQRRPVLREVTVLLFALFTHNHDHLPFSVGVVRRWLRLRQIDIPDRFQTYLRFQQAHILVELYANGLADYSFPQISLEPTRPFPVEIDLQYPANTFNMMSNVENIFVLFANAIYQARLVLTLVPNMVSGHIRYILQVTLGGDNAPSMLLTNKRNRRAHLLPLSLRFIVYNTRGLGSIPIQQHVEVLIQQYRPQIIILTDTRLPPFIGQQWAYRLGYSQLVASEPIGMTGGIWFFSDPSAVMFEQINQIPLQVMFNIRALPQPHF
ncbi:Endonuclease/exonuclease/phosphatase [Corchorus olitorius]|uniref:Endonuclease/exonuclease/phosphatase n=1 Tax=Corchorus olitorius TaxID=93759 RepID=A0A1R3G3U4_9ROSI|nr:Endonuclease/exonuclease/phosphatase [Corchorus olitorius]